MSQTIKSVMLTTLLTRKHIWAFVNSSRLPFAVALATLLVALALTVTSASEAPAATTRTIDVDNIGDKNPTAGCTLREAIDVANAGLGAGTAVNGCTVVESGTGMPITYEINLPSYTYTLSGAAGNDDNTSGDLDIIANVTINGMGASNTIIDGGGVDRVLHIPISGLGLTLNISDVTIQNGYLTSYSNGGSGICNNGNTVNISGSTITNNRAYRGSGNEGGGIFNIGGTLIISNCVISSNESGWGGGGVATYGSSTTGTDTVTITNSTITGNQSVGHGGGIEIRTVVGTTSVISCTISNNTAGNEGGGIFDIAYDSTGSTTPALNISNSTIANNVTSHDGGGISVTGGSITQTVNIANTTISGNSANKHGGGIGAYNFLGSINLVNVTVFNNVADGNNDDVGDGGGIRRLSVGEVNIKNSIVAGNSDLSGDNHDCFGTFTSLQYNLIGKNMGCIPSFPAGLPNVNNDFVGTGALPVDPILGPLAYNGGDTQTHALLPGSPAIDAIPVASCTLTTDQRGAVRPCGTACDIGAYERIPDPIFVLTKEANDTRPLPGQVITYTISLENRGYFTATNGFISDTLPTGLSLVGPVILEPSGAGDIGVYPILVHNLAIIVGQRITVTFPVAIQTDVAGVITNTAVFSSTELIAPQASSKMITVGYHIYLPLVSRNYGDLEITDTPILIRMERRNESVVKARRH